MDTNINAILETNEKVIWEGVINRKVMLSSFLITLIVTALISFYFFNQDVIHYTSNDVPKEISGRLVGAVLFGIGLFFNVLVYFSQKAKVFAITPKRTIIKSGLIGTDFQSIFFEQMRNVEVNVGLMGKIFKVGTIKIDTGKTETTSSGNSRNGSSHVSTKTMYDTLDNIDQPYEVYKYFQEALSSRKESLYSGAAYKESHPENAL